MEYFIQFQINIFAIFLLLVLFAIMTIHGKLDSYGKKVLKVIVVLTIVALIIEPLAWVFEGKHFWGAYFLEYTTNAILVILTPIIAGFMYTYVEYKVLNIRKDLVKRFLLFPPTLLTLFLLIVNFFYPIYFSIDRTSIMYTDGALRWIHYIIITLLYIFVTANSLRVMNKENKRDIIIIIMFYSLPLFGIILSFVSQYIYFTWASIVISIFVIYIFLETNSGEKDFLTALYNRNSFEKHVTELIQSKALFQVIFIDLDRFKVVNDTRGHLYGDKLLIEFSKSLSHIFSCCTMIARLGGDEFMVIVNHTTDAKKLIHALCDEIKSIPNELLNQLEFSYGIQEYELGMTLDDLYSKSDHKMYEYKKSHKKLNRRAED